MDESSLSRESLPQLGSYILLLDMPAAEEMEIGRFGNIRFSPGGYAYVGSALNGLYQRLNRHLRREKKRHWHIDYLLRKARVKGIIVCGTPERVECRIAGALSGRFKAVPGFGSSDCVCSGHLFFCGNRGGKEIMVALEGLHLEPLIISGKTEKKGER